MYAISLWLMASLRIFSGRQVLSEADSCDTGLADDDELKYMILPFSPHIYTHNIFMRPSTFFAFYCEVFAMQIIYGYFQCVFTLI